MDKVAKQLSGHVIVCGTDATAYHIAEELESYKQKERGDGTVAGTVTIARDYVVIGGDQKRIDYFAEKFEHAITVVGDATDDDILESVSIDNAFGIFPVLSNDRDNVFITFTAKQRNAKIRVVSSTVDLFNTGQKLTRAGASAIVSEHFIGGLRMVSELVRPDVTAFLDQMLRDKNSELKIEELPVPQKLQGKKLSEANLPETIGLHVVAMVKEDKTEYIYNPTADMVMAEGDTIVVFGMASQIMMLNTR